MGLIYLDTKEEYVHLFERGRSSLESLCLGAFWNVLERELFCYGKLEIARLENLSQFLRLGQDKYILSEIHEYLDRRMNSWRLNDYLRSFLTGIQTIESDAGEIFQPFLMALNTAYILGSDEIKLAARIHGSCESHGWIEGHNKKWVADIIQKGLNNSIYRDDVGWGTVLSLLLKDTVNPVILSYSACERFPNPQVLNYSRTVSEYGKPDYSKWLSLDRDRRWDISLDALRNEKSELEIHPEGWDDFFFGSGQTAFSFIKILDRQEDMI